MPKALILSKKQAEEYQALVEKANLPDLEVAAASDAAEALKSGTDYEIIFGEPSLIANVLPSMSKLRWVQTMWAGVEPLLAPSLRRDYTLTNARGIFGGLMSEYVFGYLLAFERQVLEHYRLQKDRSWSPVETGRLSGKTIGLLGVGSIGARLAETAKHFGMIVRGYTRASETCPDVDRYYHGKDLLEFATGLDYLVSVLPNTSETRQIVDKSLFDVLLPHTIFVNVGRGSAVDEAALVTALKSGQIAGAVLDVFETEPLPVSSPLWHLPNVFITYHTSARTIPTDMVGVFIENYNRYLRGEKLKYVVDFELGY